MQVIWDKTSKPHPDGQRTIVWRDRYDLEFLYIMGFVDTDRFSKDEWIDSFRDSLQKDGSYRVTQDQWFAKRAFRYSGPVGPPLDPMSIHEGLWDMKEFETFLKEKILPSTTLTEEHFRKAIEKAKKTAIKDGKYVVNRVFKFALKQLLLTYPSPRRIREMSVLEAKHDLGMSTPAKAAPQTAKPAASTVAQNSKFSEGPSAEKQTADKLSRLLWKGQK